MRFIGRTGTTAFNKGKQYLEEEDHANAYRKFTEAAEYFHHAMAQHYLGTMYQAGLYVEQNYHEAFSWYSKSADQDNIISCASIGALYRTDALDKNYEKALYWLEYAYSVSSSAIASTNLGHMYRYGEGVDIDPAKALEYYKVAVSQDAHNINSVIGDMLRDGENGLAIDYQDAEYWYTKGLAYSDSNCMIGLASLCDTDTLVNFETAFEWYLKAADCGNPKAQYFLGWYYQKGLGVKRNYYTAFTMYQKSAANGYVESYAAIGRMHHLGLISDRPSYLKAIEMYNKSIELDPSNCGAALNGIGLLYQDGLGVYENQDKAMSYFSSAVGIHNNADAYNSMGEVYKFGHGVPIDHHQAKYWFLKSAQAKNDEGQLNLALSYLVDVPSQEVDYETALFWFRKALERGNEKAQAYIDQTIHNMALLLKLSAGNDKDILIENMRRELAILTSKLKRYQTTSRRQEAADDSIINKPNQKEETSYSNSPPTSHSPPKFFHVEDMREINRKKKSDVVCKLRLEAACKNI
ncbi:hypothetical protein EDC94DRAFT_609591 [Helicostylum pulchrum]|uniref:Beta-lactamase n=1 Tax=Helicostylum pulchrum TaxID=562976 RepID=A0ABP9Y577_9FUNG|nr:hypothetical protein EDC94DRAFT_609591 [Helicostylum pulchrum]